MGQWIDDWSVGGPRSLHASGDVGGVWLTRGMLRVGVLFETLKARLGLGTKPHELLKAYEIHCDEIDAAVIRQEAESGIGAVMVRPKD
jgi:hypothetical protein